MSGINAILAQGVGPSLVEGTHAGYFSGRGNMEAEQEKRRLASQADIPAAMKGDADAFGRVAANDPKAAVAVSTALSRMDAGQQAKAKATADYTSRAANAVLQADPKDRPAIYQQMIDIGRQQGHDVSTLPPQYSPQLDPILRSHRAMGVGVQEWFKQQEETKRKQMPGGVNTGTEVWGTPPGPQSALPSTGPAVASAAPAAGLPPGVQTPPYLPPAQGVALATPQAPPGGPVAAPAGPAPVAAPPVAAASAAPIGAPQGFQAMGHRDPQGNLVPALIDGKPVYRNPQTGEMKLGEPQMAQAPAVAPVAPEPVALSSGAPGDQPPGSALPGGPQLAQATPPAAPAPRAAPGGTRTSPKIVYEDPAAQGGQIGMFRAPNGKTELIEGPGNTSIYKMPDGSFQAWKPGLVAPGKFEDVKDPSGKLIGQRDKATNQYHPINQRPDASAVGITPENENLRGDEFVATLPAGDRNIVGGLLNGTLLLQDLSKRAQDYNRYLSLAKQADPNFDPTPGGARRRFEQQFMVNGLGGQTMLAANTASDHMRTYRDLVDGLNNGNTQMVNGAINAVRRQFGDAAASNPEAAKAVLATEIAKAVRGAGALNEQEQKDYQRILSTNQSAQQTQGTLDTLSNLMLGRVHPIEDKAKALGVPDARVSQYFSPRARDALDYIKNNPLGANKKAPGIMDQIEGLFGGGKSPAPPVAPAAPAGGSQKLSPEDAAKLPPGTPFIGLDGIPRVRH